MRRTDLSFVMVELVLIIKYTYQPKGGHSPFLLMLNFQSWNQSSYSKPSTLLDSVGRCKVSESADRKDFIS